jgi:DNA-binding NarL/FixJ family response regulator
MNLEGSGPAPIRIVLADRHGMVREGIRRILDGESDLRVVGEAASGDETLSLVHRLSPEVVVADPAIPGLNGTRLIARLAAHVPAAGVVVLSGNGDEAPQAFQNLGVAACISKRSPTRELVAAVRAAGASRTRSAAEEPESPVDDTWSHDQPTARELEVLRLVELGLTTSEIAARLGVTQRTVRYHLGQIFAKLCARSRTAAVHLARERGWID